VQLRCKKLLIHIEDNRYRTELISFLEKIDHFSFKVEVINVYEEMARRFWKNHYEIFEEQNDIHLLVVGYDSFGKQIVAEAVRMYHQKMKQKLSVTILDSFPEYTSPNRIEKIPFNIEKDSLETIIEENKRKFTHIFICLDEDYIDLMEGIELSETFSDTPIYMNFTDENIEQTLMIATTKTKKSLYSTGIMQDVLTRGYLGV